MNKNTHQIRWLNSNHDWGVVMITIHWVSALTIFGMFGLGLWMVELNYYDVWYHKAPDLHKSIGITLFILTLLRLLWRLFNRCPLPLETHGYQEIRLAMSMHNFLYVMLISIMLSGYLISTADGHAISVFSSVQIPSLINGAERQEDVAGIVHLWLAAGFIGMVLLHSLATVKHHFFDRDRTLKRMFGF